MLTKRYTATSFSLRLCLHYKAARAFGVSISLIAVVPKLRQRQHRQPRSERSRVSAGGANGRTQWWRCWLCHDKSVVRLQLLSANPSQTNSTSSILAGFAAIINQPALTFPPTNDPTSINTGLLQKHKSIQGFSPLEYALGSRSSH